MRASTSSAVTMERSVYQKRREHNRRCATEGEIPAIWRRRDAAVKYPWQCGAARVGMQGLWEAGYCPLMIVSYSDDVRLLLYAARVIYAGSVNIIRSLQRMYADIYIYIQIYVLIYTTFMISILQNRISRLHCWSICAVFNIYITLH